MLELARLIYEAIGIQSPRKFVLVCAVVGALIFSGLGWLIAKGAETKLKQQTKSAPVATAPVKSGDASTSGDQSPAVTGSGNSVSYGQPSVPKKPQDKPPR
jgi:hypothetical protein